MDPWYPQGVQICGIVIEKGADETIIMFFLMHDKLTGLKMTHPRQKTLPLYSDEEGFIYANAQDKLGLKTKMAKWPL